MSPRVVGERIREARLKAGMTQTQLARAIETSDRNIQRWESGQNAPRLEHLAAIARATETDTSFFLADDEDEGEDDEEAALASPRERDILKALRPLARELARSEATT